MYLKVFLVVLLHMMVGKPILKNVGKNIIWPLYSFYLKVDEEGAEAAAATVVQFNKECDLGGPPPPPPIPFVVDHPFFFCILSPQPESNLRLPMFAGHCLLPVAKNRL